MMLPIMQDVQQEHEHLARVEGHIAEGEKRVAEQIALVERMLKEGQDTGLAEQFLQSLEETLRQWRAHRHLMLDELARV
jgi:hypothetical protein